MNSAKIALGIFILLFSLFAFAATLSGPGTLNMCQCETSNNVYQLCAGAAGSYSVSVSGANSNWISIAPRTLSLSAGECADIYTFTTPECYANSGLYPLTMSVNGTESTSKNINVSVNQCHTFNYTL